MRLLQRDDLRRLLVLSAKVGLVGLALAVIAALSAYYTVRKSVSGRDVQVPDLTRMTLAEAAALLKERGLLVEQAAQRNDDDVEEGRILAQDPPPGSAIKLERKVKVIVSLGNRVTPTPELRGEAARKAQITLQQQGMRIGGNLYVYSRRVAENIVIAQDPTPGSVGLRSGTIALLVSRGERPRTYVMPSLVGRPEGVVTTFLTRAGLKTAPSRREPGHPEPRGTVLGQDPPAGYPVSVGDPVTLTVAGESAPGG